MSAAPSARSPQPHGHGVSPARATMAPMAEWLSENRRGYGLQVEIVAARAAEGAGA